MAVGIIAVFIPIIIVLVIGLMFVTYYYFRTRERQLLIEKGLDTQSIKQFFENKRDPFVLMKIGIVAVAFGIGLGLGMALQDSTGKDYWIPFFLFTFTGIGFVVANIVARKLDKSVTD
jgi:purine-cytosine permease-like protein